MKAICKFLSQETWLEAKLGMLAAGHQEGPVHLPLVLSRLAPTSSTFHGREDYKLTEPKSQLENGYAAAIVGFLMAQLLCPVKDHLRGPWD